MFLMEKIVGKSCSGERSLFGVKDLELDNVTFFEGESPLKETEHILVKNCSFSWKYPLWYSKELEVRDSRFYNESHAGIWCTKDSSFDGCVFEEGKNFRHAENIEISNCVFSKASETIWWCEKMKVQKCSFAGDYLGLGSKNSTFDSIEVNGNYPFDGSKNIHIKNSVLHSKDAFWNSENILIEDSVIESEYFGWNSKNVKLVRTKIVSHQGFCYMDNVTLIDCEMHDSDLTFEYVSNANVTIVKGELDLKNPISGTFIAPSFKAILLNDKRVEKEHLIFQKSGDLDA